MIRLKAEDHILQDLTIADIAAYLDRVGSGWQRAFYHNDRLIAFEGPDDDHGNKIRLLLPTSNDFWDAKERIAEALNILSVVEHELPDNIVHKVRRLGHDTISLRLFTPGTSSPPLERAIRIMNGFKDLIYFAACMEERPRAYIPGRRQKIGYQQIQSCQFGHTFQGSFGFTIEVPLFELQLTLPHISGYIPMSRRVVERIMRGLSWVREAERQQNYEIISKNFLNGLNYNMCLAALETFDQDQDSKMEYAVSWSPLLDPEGSLRNVEPVLVSKSTRRYIEEAARYLKGNNEEILEAAVKIPLLPRVLSEQQNIQGKVTDLSAQSKNRRIASIFWNGERQVNVPLQPEFYEAAFKAHIDFMTVSVTGTLIEEHGELLLNDVTDFSILD